MSLRQPSLSDKENFEAIADMRSFEQRITSYRGDDPLDLWIKCESIESIMFCLLTCC
jgi:hypothetical protein